MVNAFAHLLRPVPSVLDYTQQLNAIDAENLQRQAVQQQMQERTRALQAAEQERNALSSLIKQSGGDSNKLVGLLESSGMPSFWEKAQGLRKSALEARGKEATIAKDAATTRKTALEAQRAGKSDALSSLQMLRTPEEAQASLSEAVQAGQLGMQEAQRIMQMIPQDPQGFAQWKQMMLEAAMSAEKRGELQARARTDATTRELAGMTDARIRSEGAANRAVQTRGQNLADARARELATITKTDKEERRKAEKQEQGVTKFAATLQKDGIPEIEAALAGAEGIFKRYTDPKTGKVGDMPGIGAITNALPDWAVSSEGRDVRESLQSVANIVLAARSGASVTDQELRRLARELSNSLGASEQDMARAYTKFRERFELVKANAAAGVSDEVLGEYTARGGVPITRGGKRPEAKPAAGGVDLGGGFRLKP